MMSWLNSRARSVTRRPAPASARNRAGRRSLLALVALLAASPFTWAPPANAQPGEHRLRRAAVRALRDPHTWGPAAGAAAVVITDSDERISDWARGHAPIFGSQSNANVASDNLRSLTDVAVVATALAAPRDADGPWGSRWARLGVDVGTAATIVVAVHGLKEAAKRERPDQENDLSFPSGHAASAFGEAALARRNVARMDLPRGGELACDAAFDTLAGLTSWARIEAGEHYPTDVLVGASLGNFLASFLDEALLGRHDMRVAVDVGRDAVGFNVSLPLGRKKQRARALMAAQAGAAEPSGERRLGLVPLTRQAHHG